MQTLHARLRIAGDLNTVTTRSSGLLFHGTLHGRTIDRFNTKTANWGVGSNAMSQGNHGVYFTNSLQAARYFSRKAGEFYELMRKDRPQPITGESVQEAHNLAWERLFGAKDGTIVVCGLKPHAKIKVLDIAPNELLVQQLKTEGYDAISFPEAGFKNTEDYPSRFKKQSYLDAVASRTTVVLNLDTISILANVLDMEELQSQVQGKSKKLTEPDIC